MGQREGVAEQLGTASEDCKSVGFSWERCYTAVQRVRFLPSSQMLGQNSYPVGILFFFFCVEVSVPMAKGGGSLLRDVWMSGASSWSSH